MKIEPEARLPISPAKDAQGDFAQFTDFMRRLVAVPHSQIKASWKQRSGRLNPFPLSTVSVS